MLSARRYALVAAIAAVVACGRFSSAVNARATSGRPASAAVRARLRSIIVTFARQNGDAHPTDLRMVETTSTYEVAATGHFVANDASPPAGAKAPTGIGLWMVLQRNSTFAVTGWGVDRFDVDLRKLGKVQNL